MFRSMVPWRERSFRPVVRLEREMEDLWDRFFGGQEGWLAPADGFTPRVDVVEGDGAFEVKIDLPGMKPEEFNVELQNGSLLVSGKKEEEHEESDKTYHRVERRYGEFRRVIALPSEVAADKISAEYHDGVLKISVPKTEAAKPRRIEVKGSQPTVTAATAGRPK